MVVSLERSDSLQDTIQRGDFEVIKKFYLLNEMKNKYDILSDGTVINKKTGKQLKYYTWNNRKFVSLYYQSKYWQYTEQQIIDFVGGKYYKAKKCKICNLWTNNELCNFCQIKILNVRKEVLIKREALI